MLKRETNELKSNFNLEDNIINGLIEKYGENGQILLTIERMNVFENELLKDINRNLSNKENILKKFVDVEFMLRQIKSIYNFTDEEVQNKLEEKIAENAKLL